MMAFVFSCKCKCDCASDNTPPYTIQLTEITNDSFPSLHSFTHAIYQDSFIVMFGGRTGGLHSFNYTFAESFSDSVIYVINTHNLDSPKKWTIASMRYENNIIPGNDTNTLDSSTVPQPALKSIVDKRIFMANNAEFYTKDSMLYVFGGLIGAFGTAGAFPAPYLTIIKIPDLINTVINKTAMKPNSIRQIYDTSFAITGGEIDVLNNKTYLTFGWDANNTYSHQVKVYSILDNGTNIVVKHDASYSDGYPSNITNAGNFRRRDGSMCAMINPQNDSNMLFYFAGVFKGGVTNFTSVVKITDNYAKEIDSNTFTMRSNIYTCQVVPVYDKQNKKSYATFLGGITNTTFTPGANPTYPVLLDNKTAPINDTAGKTQNFTFVPFTNHFSTVCLDTTGKLSQYMMAESFPPAKKSYHFADTTIKKDSTVYNGAESELFWTISSKNLINGMIDFQALKGDTTTVGYLYGGILSALPNVLSDSTGQKSYSHRYSKASNRLFKVSIIKTHKK